MKQTEIPIPFSDVSRAPSLRAGIVVACLLTGACAAGPDFHAAKAPEGAGYTAGPLVERTAAAPAVPGGDPERFVMGRDIPFAWWKEFGSARLDALVERALADSPTLEAAQSALRQAHQQTAAQRGFFFPSVTGSFTPSRQQIAGNMSSNDPGQQGNGNVLSATTPQPLIYTFYTAQVGVSYSPDVFGGNRRQVESLKAQEEATRFQMEAAYITLTTNVVAAALQEAALEGQIGAAKTFVEVNRKALDILHAQLREGLVTRLDVAQQESALAQAEAQLPPLAKQLEQTHDLIRALVGALPNDQADLTFDLDSFRLPRELPLSLPAQLIAQRPDVRAAEAQVHSASAEVGVAFAARLPQFTITGAYGGAAQGVDQLFAAGGPFWNIIGNVMAPIFDGGTLAHRHHAAREALVQARAQYRGTVIAAFQNVADTLHAVQADADGLVAAGNAETAAKVTLDITRDQYRAGYVSYQTLLLAEGAYQQALVGRIQAQTNRYGDAASLFQALGGGWWNRTAANTDGTSGRTG